MKTPWKTGCLTSWIAMTGRPVKYIYRDDNETHETRIAVFGGKGEKGKQEYDCDADAELIVECVNALDNRNPSALAALEAACDSVAEKRHHFRASRMEPGICLHCNSIIGGDSHYEEGDGLQSRIEALRVALSAFRKGASDGNR